MQRFLELANVTLNEFDSEISYLPLAHIFDRSDTQFALLKRDMPELPCVALLRFWLQMFTHALPPGRRLQPTQGHMLCGAQSSSTLGLMCTARSLPHAAVHDFHAWLVPFARQHVLNWAPMLGASAAQVMASPLCLPHALDSIF